MRPAEFCREWIAHAPASSSFGRLSSQSADVRQFLGDGPRRALVNSGLFSTRLDGPFASVPQKSLPNAGGMVSFGSWHGDDRVPLVHESLLTRFACWAVAI